jgi:hypothetical protein
LPGGFFFLLTKAVKPFLLSIGFTMLEAVMDG